MNRQNQRSLWPSLALGLVISTGFACTWLILVNILILIPEARRASRQVESVEITPSGEAYVRWFTPGEANFHWRTLAGRDVLVDRNIPTVQPVTLSAAAPRPFLEDIGWYNRVWGFNDQASPVNRWYLVHDGRPQGDAYFVGYSSLNNRIVGYLGKNGYRPDLPPRSEQFPVDLQLLASGQALAGRNGAIGVSPVNYGSWPLPIYLLSDEAVYRIDLDERTVAPVPTDERVLSIGTASEVEHRTVDGQAATAVRELPVFRTVSQFIFPPTSSGNPPPGPLPIPAELRDQFLSLYLCPGPEKVLLRSHPLSRLAGTVYWLDEAGAIVRSQPFRLAGSQLQSTSTTATHWQIAALLPAIGPLFLVDVVLAPDRIWADTPDYGSAVRRALAYGWPALLTVAAIGGLMAAWVYRRQRRDAHWGAVAWAIFVFLLGPFGLAGYWLHRNWPTRVACIQCGQRAPRDRGACVHCGSEFPAPAPLGTEVFV